MSSSLLTPADFLEADVLSPRVSDALSSTPPSQFHSENYLAYQEDHPDSRIDPRILNLSYSSLQTLHSCPRKFQLYKLRSSYKTGNTEKETITFAFGHCVGEAIQFSLAGLSKNEIIWKLFQTWDAPLFAEDEKANKSFWSSLLALDRFVNMRDQGFLDGYELAHFNGKPAIELSFCVVFPDGFRLRGYVDAVLIHRDTGAVLVLEAKTTGSASFSPSQFKNSAQGIGYSIVLDVIAPGINSYEVLYLVYQTKTGEFTPIPFTKTYLQRALWIKELLLDIETIKMYEEHAVYPMRGESCYSFFRDCQYINTCQLSTKYLTNPYDEEKDGDKEEYQINLTLMDLIDAQLSKTSDFGELSET